MPSLKLNKSASHEFDDEGNPECQARRDVRWVQKICGDLFPAETAELIKQQDRHLLAGNQQVDAAVQTVSTPNNGRRPVVARRLRIAGDAGESQIFLSVIEDRTDQAIVGDVAA
jgi:PAS fold